MVTLNNMAARMATALPAGTVSACTDITGFGLVGHATEVAAASGTTLAFDSGSLPLLNGAAELAAANLPCGGRSNIGHFRRVTVGPDVAPEVALLCMDPQTSGGLLFSLAPDAAAGFVDQLEAAGVRATRVGWVEPRGADDVLVRLS